MSYVHLEVLREKIKNNPHLSVRGVAYQLGISHSALSKILRGQTYTVSEHMDHVLTHWLYPEREISACMCPRCQKPEKSLQTRVEALEGVVMDFRERVENLEKVLHASTRSLSPFVCGI